MLNQEEQLAIFVEAINQNAEKLCKKIEKDTDKYYKTEAKKLEIEALNEKIRKIQYASNEINNLMNKKTAEYKSQSRKELVEKREEITEKVFDLLFEKIKSFTLTEKYREYIRKCLDEIIALTKENEIEVFCSLGDEEIVKKISEEYSVSIKITPDKSIILGGISAYCPKMSKKFVNTVDSKISDAKEKFRSKSELLINL